MAELSHAAAPSADRDYVRGLVDFGRPRAADAASVAALRCLRLIDDALDAGLRDRHEIADALPLGGVDLSGAEVADHAEDLVHIGSDAGLSLHAGQHGDNRDFQSHKASGELIVEVDDRGCVGHAEAPAGENGDCGEATTVAVELRAIDALDVAESLHDAMRRLAVSSHVRTARGWVALDGSFVEAPDVTRLCLRNLAKVTRHRQGDTVTLTDLGREIADALPQRANAGGHH